MKFLNCFRISNVNIDLWISWQLLYISYPYVNPWLCDDIWLSEARLVNVWLTRYIIVCNDIGRTTRLGGEAQFTVYCNSAGRELDSFLISEKGDINYQFHRHHLCWYPISRSLPYVSMGSMFVFNKWRDNFGGSVQRRFNCLFNPNRSPCDSMQR